MLSTRIALCALLVSTAACTDAADSEPAVGQTQQLTSGAGAAATILASSVLGDAEVETTWDGTKAKVEADVRLIMQEIVLQPGGYTGWHTHPGVAFASIVSGTLTLYDAHDPCSGTAFGAGTAFVDHGGTHVHNARNEGTTPMTVRVQYVVPNGSAVRIDAPAPAGACF